MKNELDVNKLREKAKNFQVSIYTLAKREINYRKPNRKDIGKRCEICKFRVFPVFNHIERTQCFWVGVSEEKTADINNNMVCNYYKRGYIPKEKDSEEIQ